MYNCGSLPGPSRTPLLNSRFNMVRVKDGMGFGTWTSKVPMRQYDFNIITMN